MIIPCLVYLLCTATCIVCAVLLWRGFYRSRARLLRWSAWCFVGLAINNVLLFLDMIVFPQVDLSLARDVTCAMAVAVLLIGLIWDAHE